MCWTQAEWRKRLARAETYIQSCAGLNRSDDVKAVAFWKFREAYPNSEEIFDEAWRDHVNFIIDCELVVYE